MGRQGRRDARSAGLRLRAAAAGKRRGRAGDRVEPDHDARRPRRAHGARRRVPKRRGHGLVRTVVVTGGGKGIGRAVCDRFAAEGDRVVAVGRTHGEVDEVCDVTDEQAVAELFDRIGVVDVLVNNAGIGESSPLAQVTLAEWRRHLDVNATAPFLCTRAVLPGMLERNSGRIVTVASTAARAGTRFTAAYTASKHAAVGLMRAVAAEVGGTGVTANAVCP